MLKEFRGPRIITYTRDYSPEDYLDGAIYIGYRKHLLRNREHILETGYPKIPFTGFLSMDLKLSRAYPVKLPLHVMGEEAFYRDVEYFNATPDIYREITEYDFSWGRSDPLPNYRVVLEYSKKISPRALIKNIFPMLETEEAVTYDEAARLSFFSQEEATRLEGFRGRIFDLKLKVLDLIVDFIEEGQEAKILLTKALDAIADTLNLDEIDFLFGIEKKYTENLFSNYLNALMVPLVHNFQLYLPSGMLDEVPEGLSHPPRAFVNCGGISDILFFLGDLGVHRIYRTIKTRKEDDPAEVFFRRRKRIFDHWTEMEYVLYRFLEKQMKRNVNLSATLKGEYIDKFAPLLEKILGLEAEYINEHGKAYPLAELIRQEKSGADDKSPTAYLFRKAGEGYEVAFRGKPSFFLKETVGLNYIYILLTNRNRIISVKDLVYINSNGSGGEASIDQSETSIQTEGGSSNAQYSYQDLVPIYKKVTELREEHQKANDEGNYDRADELRPEIEKLQEYIADSLNQKNDPELERKRTSVKNAISSALSRIKKHDPDMARHLEEKLETGYACLYKLSPSDEIDWKFS